MNNISTLKNDEARPDMDVMLHDYFQAALPHPWPTFKPPSTTRTRRPAPVWARYAGRMALAACVALLIAGYLTLSGYFPRPHTPSGVVPLHNIGMKDKGGPTPHK